MKNKKIIIILVILVLLGLAFYLFTTFKTKPIQEEIDKAVDNVLKIGKMIEDNLMNVEYGMNRYQSYGPPTKNRV